MIIFTVSIHTVTAMTRHFLLLLLLLPGAFRLSAKLDMNCAGDEIGTDLFSNSAEKPVATEERKMKKNHPLSVRGKASGGRSICIYELL